MEDYVVNLKQFNTTESAFIVPNLTVQLNKKFNFHFSMKTNHGIPTTLLAFVSSDNLYDLSNSCSYKFICTRYEGAFPFQYFIGQHTVLCRSIWISQPSESVNSLYLSTLYLSFNWFNVILIHYFFFSRGQIGRLGCKLKSSINIVSIQLQFYSVQFNFLSLYNLPILEEC